MTVKITYENTETGERETRTMPDDNWILAWGKASDFVEALAHGIGSRNGIMREFRCFELAEQAFRGLLPDNNDDNDPSTILAPVVVTDELRQQAHDAILKASLTFDYYVTTALAGLPRERRDDARRLAKELGLTR